MPTRPSKAHTEVLQDIRTLLKGVTPAILAAWAAEDRAKKKKGGIDKAFVDQLRRDVATLDSMRTPTSKQATQREVEARKALRAELQSLRDDVAEVFPDDKDLQHSYGVGKMLSADSTTHLLEAADGVASAFEADGAAVADAGVTEARIAKIAKLRGELAAADTEQRAAIAARKTVTATKTTLLASVTRRASLLRKRLAKLAPKAKGKGGASKSTVGSTARRHRVKKRTPKTTAT